MARDLCTPDSASPCRETLALMPEGTEVVMYILFTVAAGFFVYGFWQKYRTYRRGRDAPLEGSHKERIVRFFKRALGQAKVARKRYAGPMHALIFYGFITLFAGTLLVALDYDITQPLLNWQLLKGGFYLFFEFALDLAGVALFLGLVLAIKRRVFDRPEALKSTWQDTAILTTLMLLTLQGFMLEAMRIVLRSPAWADASFVGASLAPMFTGLTLDTIRGLYVFTWWFHAGLTFVFIGAIPYTKLHHMITSPANIYTAPLYGPTEAKGKLPTPFNLKEAMETGDYDFTVGAKRVEDFTWKDLLAVDACTECGRCQESCPAYAAGRPLSPMQLVLDLRQAVRDKGPLPKDAPEPEAATTNELVDDIIRSETLWSCVTCRACMEACPVDITHVPLIVDMRRGLVGDMKIDKNQSDLLTNLTNTGNAYGLPAADRAKWATDLDVPIVGDSEVPPEVLYWVGCSGSYDPRNQNVSRSVAILLEKAGVNFAILGPNERCTGDPARRLGEEGRFQELALSNVETINAADVRTVIAQCPHCFNTIKNEYPEFGLNEDVEIVHHSVFLDRLVKDGKLAPQDEVMESFTYHEPCYLGRYNDEYESARDVLRVIPNCQLNEMGRIRENSFCCGAGGANMWFEVKDETERISGLRMVEAISTRAKGVATSCPFCLTMLEDQARIKGGASPPRVMDVAEILAQSVTGKQQAMPDSDAAVPEDDTANPPA